MTVVGGGGGLNNVHLTKLVGLFDGCTGPSDLSSANRVLQYTTALPFVAHSLPSNKVNDTIEEVEVILVLLRRGGYREAGLQTKQVIWDQSWASKWQRWPFYCR